MQDPADAESGAVPPSATQQVRVDSTVRARDLAALIVRLAGEPVRVPWEVSVSDGDRRRVESEFGSAFRRGIVEFGRVTPQTCREYGVVRVQIKEGGFARYRCHTGHAYTGDALLAAVTEHVEETLWRTVRTLEEATRLESTGAELAENGDTRLAQAYARKAQTLELRSRGLGLRRAGPYRDPERGADQAGRGRVNCPPRRLSSRGRRPGCRPSRSRPPGPSCGPPP